MAIIDPLFNVEVIHIRKKYSSYKIASIVVFIIIGMAIVISCPASWSGELSDTAISAGIKAKLSEGKLLSSSSNEINVETTNGVVTLSGHVLTTSEFDRIFEITYSAPGVTEIKAAGLTVQEGKQTIEDALITAKVKKQFANEAIFGDKLLYIEKIHVKTTDGIVYLNGRAETNEQIESLKKIAMQVEGVKAVRSRILVKQRNPQ